MRGSALFSCGLALSLVTHVVAQQEAIETPLPEEISYQEVDTSEGASRLWGGAEYLFWWSKEAPQPIPLITNGTGIGQDGSIVLLGGEDLDVSPSSGARFTAGWWIDSDRTWGLEAGGFFLGRESATRSVGSNASGSPSLTVPFFDEQLGAESRTFVSFPDVFSGWANVNVSSELYGVEGNLVRDLYRTERTNIQALTGIRYLNLRESLSFYTETNLIAPQVGSLSTSDDFLTINEFYGGQLGALAERTMGIFSVRTVGKLGLGSMQETVRIDGVARATEGNAFLLPTYFPGGYFALPSNRGSKTTQRFAVVPQFDITFGVQLTTQLRATVGYSFLFLSTVARPGDQMDRTINPSQSPTFDGSSTLVGDARPGALLESSTYWAQGLNFGLEYTY